MQLEDIKHFVCVCACMCVCVCVSLPQKFADQQQWMTENYIRPPKLKHPDRHQIQYLQKPGKLKPLYTIL